MCPKQTFNGNQEIRKRRRFSDDFKREKVLEITSKMVTMAQISRQYQVRTNTINKWIECFGPENPYRGARFIVELESDTHRIAALEAKVKQLELLIGQKEVLVNFQWKVIDTAEEMYGVDIKKKLINKLSNDVGLSVTRVEPKA